MINFIKKRREKVVAIFGVLRERPENENTKELLDWVQMRLPGIGMLLGITEKRQPEELTELIKLIKTHNNCHEC